MGDSLIIGFGIVVLLIVIAFLYEMSRRLYYWSAAKRRGWSDAEKFERETAWLDRSIDKEKKQADRDAAAFRDTERRRYGVFIAAMAMVLLGYNLNLSWWEVTLMSGVMYAGLTMAAGLAWKLW